jgi:hypothetical protein
MSLSRLCRGNNVSSTTDRLGFSLFTLTFISLSSLWSSKKETWNERHSLRISILPPLHVFSFLSIFLSPSTRDILRKPKQIVLLLCTTVSCSCPFRKFERRRTRIGRRTIPSVETSIQSLKTLRDSNSLLLFQSMSS